MAKRRTLLDFWKEGVRTGQMVLFDKGNMVSIWWDKSVSVIYHTYFWSEILGLG
jgi:hypothetical protein